MHTSRLQSPACPRRLVCNAGAPCLQSAMRGRPACSLRCGGALPAQLCAGCVIPLSLRIVLSVPLLLFNCLDLLTCVFCQGGPWLWKHLQKWLSCSSPQASSPMA